MTLCSQRTSIQIHLLVCGIRLVLILLSLVFIQSVLYCMSVSEPLLALFHLRLLVPLHRFLPSLPPDFAHPPPSPTSHDHPPPFTVSLENLFGAIQKKTDNLSLCCNYFIADRRMDVREHRRPGTSLHARFRGRVM